ncbi:MAG: primosomal protein N' [Synechococcaceae bacterium WBA_2_066]|nr:primosomal protein N' [Synechococcaceae bacterium WB6_1B_055]NBQ18056.1 primosomal protein N' [Synechococcaceae bacterium WB5_2A_257]NBY59199.1 primosomal protein N' [Synechococcaceae bacterium LLD_019]NCY13165.1 primosomal protein N' [Synechococcaceae bacterium WB8_1A_041]NDC05698.1 primosomal protein N' [Synechococcaceae bacterium WB9_2_069]NDE36934.1 primosomal protein N' [Synechococcaceae bacterium WBA_2_066]NDG02136.1 primosomal protein N' [Synechococcaceae bacterium WBB_34_004]NDG77
MGGLGTAVNVWVEAGREGLLLTYSHGDCPALQKGDLVRVKLRGRLHNGLVYSVNAEPPEGLALEPVLERLENAAINERWLDLLVAVADQCHTAQFQVLKTALPNGWLGKKQQAAGLGCKQLVASAIAGAAPACLTKKQQGLLEKLQLTGSQPAKELIAAGFGRSLLKALERKGLVQLKSELQPPKGWPSCSSHSLEIPPELNPDQAAVLERLKQQSNQRQWLLWGVTGSGKTEIYLRCCAPELAAGKSVLLLTPEIGLIPQLLERCRRRFAGAVVAYHSGLSEGERLAAWRHCRSGSPCIVVGTRSAIFLPLPKLGLIVLDEEHDSSYKQEAPMPCYHARDVARLRQEKEGCLILLGSATPCLETWLACQGAKASIGLLRLPQRIAARPLPPVKVVDMRLELAEGHRRLLSRQLLDRLSGLADRGQQAVVLVPRRGYNTFLSCRSCGEAVSCPHCDVSLTVHRNSNGQSWLRCHWCDHREELANRCGNCGSTAFKPFGAGTQKVLEQLEQELEGVRLLRFDRDSTRGRDGHKQLLDRFAAGEADVLVGTQMLAKGMDLPKVTLAVVLAADGLLHRPDLRAAEQSLQLLLQLAGRAGRGEQPGEVLVQTYDPDHRVIKHLLAGSYEQFLEEEVALRRSAGLVPFSRACLLRFAGMQASTTASAATTLLNHVSKQLKAADWLAIGPAPAPRAKVAGLSRWQLLLQGPPSSAIPLPTEQELRQLLPKGVNLAIDPDPLEL